MPSLDGWSLVFEGDGSDGGSSLRSEFEATAAGSSLWQEESASKFLERLKNFETSYIFSFAVWCLRIYAQSMWVGPDLTDSEVAQLPKSFFDKEALQLMTSDGELMESLVDYPGALYIGRELLSRNKLHTPPQHWWLGRSALMHHRSLAGGLDLCDCPILKKEVFEHYITAAKAIGLLPLDFSFTDDQGVVVSPTTTSTSTSTTDDLSADEKCRLLIELLNVFTFYNLGSFFRSYLEEHCEAWPYSIELTGRRGIRRIHQKDAIPQLCVIVKSTAEASESELTDSPFPRQSEVPRDIGLTDLDVTNDIFSRPKFTDASEEGKMSLLSKFYLLAWANERLKESSLDDDIGLSVIGSLTAEILETSDKASECLEAITAMEADADWCLWGNALYSRSRAEFNRPKTKERSCLQILTLEEQVLRPNPSAAERLRSLWLTGYPNKWELRREVGKKFREMGAPLTARDMFVKMHMWTDVIECLVSVGRKNEALELVDQQLKEDPTSPMLWFLKGEVSSSHQMEFYIKSWDLSRHRFYRATNALAHHCLKESVNNTLALEDRKELIERALSYFKETVALKPHMFKTQFTYGCLLMEHGSDAEALSAFNAVLLHDSNDNFQVWANMGAIHCRTRNWLSALKCFQQAARLAQNKWRIWDSYIKVCFVLRDYLGALEGLQKMLEINSGDQIPSWMLERLVSKVASSAEESSLTSEHFTQRVEKFFKDYFLQVEMPLPSRRNCAQVITIFDSEQFSSSIERLELWVGLAKVLHKPKDRLPIIIKCFREVIRVLEDSLSHELPKQFWKDIKSYTDLIESLCDTWSRIVEELFDQLAEARDDCASEYEEKRMEFARLVEGSERRLKVQINGCSLLPLEDREKCSKHLIS